MSDLPRIAGTADIKALEEIPLAEWLSYDSCYAAIAAGMALDENRPALQFLSAGDPTESPLTISYGQLKRQVDQVANLLRSLGVKKGDPVSVLMPNLLQKFLLLLGNLPATVFSPVNWMLEAPLIADIIRAAGSKVLITLGPTDGYEIWHKVISFLPDIPELEHVLYVTPNGQPADQLDTKDQRVRSFDTLLEETPDDELTFKPVVTGDDIVAYIHTGGTTGSPKLAKITHRGLLHEFTCIATMIGLQPDDILIGGGVLFHVGAVAADTLAPLSVGATIVIPSPLGFRERRVIENYWRIVEQFRATRMSGVVTTLSALLNQSCDDADISTLRTSATGGMGMPEEIGRAIKEKTGINVLSTYGMTEVSGASSMAPRDGDPRYGSGGIPMPHFRHRIVNLDDDGKYLGDCEEDEIGNIIMAGPGIIPGYVDASYDRHLFVKDYEPGWVNSGDLGRLDAEGYLWITGRAKDVIIRGGHNIDPSIIEEVLYKYPDIADAAAVGKPDAYAGELPVAYVQLKPGAIADENGIKAYCREHILERAANPTEIIFIDRIPLTGVGKIFKLELRRDAARRVFSELLQSVQEEDVEISVSIDPEPHHGSVASLTITSQIDVEKMSLEAQIAELFKPFSMPYRLVWLF